MMQMQSSLNRFLFTVLAVWVAGSIGAVFYAHQQNIPTRITAVILPALLLEVAMYLATGFAGVRSRLLACGSALPALLVGSALPGYLLTSVAFGGFRVDHFALLIALTAIFVFWYRVLPRRLGWDLLFLAFGAAVVLSKVFGDLYVNPAVKPKLDILGRMMWVRLGIMSVLLLRGAPGVDYGFIPRVREWAVGARYYAYALALITPLAFGLGFVQRPSAAFTSKTMLTAALTFAGMLWFVALFEELFFRGLLQQWLSDSMGNTTAGLLVTSVLFGSAHLGFGRFPNWKFAIIATCAGVIYGMAYARAGLRGSMVTHALLATTWRVVFG